MTIRLFKSDGLTLIALVDIPHVDQVPPVAIWEGRAFLLRLTDPTNAAYAEALTLRLELPAGAGL